MSRHLGVLAVVLLSAFCACRSEDLVVFGDSLSDSGVRSVGGGSAAWIRTVLLLGNETFPQPPYSNGRFSNGPVWVDAAAASLGISYINFAAGGATSGAKPGTLTLPAGFDGLPSPFQMLVPPLAIQLDQYYLATNNTADPEAAYVILIGGNDYIGISQGYNVTAEEVVDIVEMTMENLFKHGARRFILGTVPPSALLPPFLAALPEVVEAFDAHNELLRDLADTFPTDHGRTSVWVFDFGGEVLRVATDFRKLGFTSQEPCYSVSNLGEGGAEVCANPAAHFRWDVLHPTTAAHAIIGEAFVQQLGETVFGKGGSTYTPTGGYGG